MDTHMLDNIFGYHPPQDQATIAKHEKVRRLCRELASELNDLVPPSPEQTLAIRGVETAMMYANAGIARVEPEHLERRAPR